MQAKSFATKEKESVCLVFCTKIADIKRTIGLISLQFGQNILFTKNKNKCCSVHVFFSLKKYFVNPIRTGGGGIHPPSCPKDFLSFTKKKFRRTIPDTC